MKHKQQRGGYESQNEFLTMRVVTGFNFKGTSALLLPQVLPPQLPGSRSKIHISIACIRLVEFQQRAIDETACGRVRTS